MNVVEPIRNKNDLPSLNHQISVTILPKRQI